MPAKGRTISVIMTSELCERIERFLESPVSGVKSKRALLEKSVERFLDQEEVVVAELERELLRIRGA